MSEGDRNIGSFEGNREPFAGKTQQGSERNKGIKPAREISPCFKSQVLS